MAVKGREVVIEHPREVLSIQHELRRMTAFDGADQRMAEYRAIQDQVNKQTFAEVENLWLDNLQRNRKRIKRAGDARVLLDGIAGPNRFPIIVGAAPSLKTNWEGLLQRDPKIMPIIAVNSALPFLLDKGIKPEFVVAVDADPVVAEHLDNGWFDSHLICSTLVHPKVVDTWKGPMSFLWYELNALMGRKQRRLIQKLDERGRKHFMHPWPAMGNVFNMGVCLSVLVMKAKTIVLCGNELSWKDENEMHVDDATAPTEVQPGMAIARNQKGDIVYTNHTMWLYKLLLEHFLSQFPVNVFEASEGGVFGLTKDGPMPNVTHTTLDKAMEFLKKQYRAWSLEWQRNLERIQAAPWTRSGLMRPLGCGVGSS